VNLLQRKWAGQGRPSSVKVTFSWMYDVTRAAAQEAITDLGTAFRAFFEKRGRHPRFKRKDDRQRFCAANEEGTFRTRGKRIKLPVIGWVRMRETVRFTGRLKRATVLWEAGRWFAACGEVRPDARRRSRVKRASVKQEEGSDLREGA
jgi:transposase